MSIKIESLATISLAFAEIVVQHGADGFLARSANLPIGLCILPSVISSFFLL